MSNTPYHFGITPHLQFTDTSAVLVGEKITLSNNIAYEFIETPITLNASKLNTNIVDEPLGTSDTTQLSYTGTPDICFTDIGDVYDLTISLTDMGKGSAKATIAKAITGNPLGDIGEIENDSKYDGLLDEATLQTAIAESITPEAIISVAEDILRSKGISDTSNGGREPTAPFEADDELIFNMLIANGEITIELDPKSNIDNETLGVNFFSGPVHKFTDDTLNGESYTIAATDNVYSKTDYRYTTADLRYDGKPNNNNGFVEATDGGESFGAVLVRLKMKLTQ